MTDTRSTPRPPDLNRRTLSTFGYAVCVLVPLLIAALGFTFLHFHYDKEDLVAGTRVSILTSDWKTGDPSDQASLSGQLVIDGACVRVQTADGAMVTPVWPRDWEVTIQRVGSADQVKVYDVDRDIVARSEQTIEVTGGAGDPTAYAGTQCAPDAGDQVFLVQSDVRVVDTGA